ncbi:hypothetical protein H2200_002036 [Cladophialophora chaetospira]|uniref:HMG box domain-containing protein n=1 Tax=Cladophialophora chaetospira TaxID=386627 RepID=A0AA38XI38_9EURO|nr:hypothetical protein H2200_002036 [Cladophialophora chaetospira]
MDSVSAFLAGGTDSLPVGLPKAQIDLIWLMGVASFPSSKNELVIPQFVGVKLSSKNIDDLKCRFSVHFDNAPAMEVFDPAAKVLRIRRAPELPVFAGDSAYVSSSESRCATPQSITSASSPAEDVTTMQSSASAGTAAGKKLQLPSKKAKVSRPPNAFILYRTYYHPILLKSRPDLMNNDISVMLGKQWKAESNKVKDEWKAKAERVKKQHALENPGYQYAPRKPSEKKRRMTARKLAKLHADQAAEPNSDIEMTDVAELTNAAPTTLMAKRPHEVALFFENDEEISIDTCLANERVSSYPSRFQKNRSTDEMSIVFPAGRDDIEQDYNIKSARYEPRDPSERINLSRATYSDVRAQPDLSTIAGDQFMDTMIDWDAIEADAQIVHNTVNENTIESLKFDNVAERAQFQAEMNRVLAMFD